MLALHVSDARTGVCESFVAEIAQKWHGETMSCFAVSCDVLGESTSLADFAVSIIAIGLPFEELFLEFFEVVRVDLLLRRWRCRRLRC